MNIFKVIAFCIIATIFCIILSQQKKEYAILLSIISCIGIMMYALNSLFGIVDVLKKLIENSGISMEFLKIILKVVGITYLVEFGKNICNDAGQTAISKKIEMAGKIIIVSISIPILTSLVNVLSGLI